MRAPVAAVAVYFFASSIAFAQITQNLGYLDVSGDTVQRAAHRLYEQQERICGKKPVDLEKLKCSTEFAEVYIKFQAAERLIRMGDLSSNQDLMERGRAALQDAETAQTALGKKYGF
ncbi:hypothetical protein C4568_00115 [Candidatus Parcubacteria bacterium]|nr:MAG: hypothetical protein C4568_00115 [Candidatus Parcubacteria bacterium]